MSSNNIKLDLKKYDINKLNTSNSDKSNILLIAKRKSGISFLTKKDIDEIVEINNENR